MRASTYQYIEGILHGTHRVGGVVPPFQLFGSQFEFHFHGLSCRDAYAFEGAQRLDRTVCLSVLLEIYLYYFLAVAAAGIGDGYGDFCRFASWERK